jgi:hypothetical protein
MLSFSLRSLAGLVVVVVLLLLVVVLVPLVPLVPLVLRRRCGSVRGVLRVAFLAACAGNAPRVAAAAPGEQLFPLACAALPFCCRPNLPP